MRRGAIPLLLLVAALPARAGPAEEPPCIDGQRLMAHVKFLSSDDMEGRAAGSQGAQASTEYAAEQFRILGLEPAGDDGTFFQGFDLPRGVEIREETRLEVSRDGREHELAYGDDLVPLSLSGPGDVTAGAVFCGYGVSAPDLGYDDYAGVEVTGKVAFVLRHAPGSESRKSPFAAPALQRRHATFQAKVATARAAGAAALVIVNDPLACWKPKDDVLRANVGGESGAMPVFHVTYRAARRLGKILDIGWQREQKALDARLTPRSRDLEGAQVHLVAALDPIRLPVRNVCARLRAPEGGADEALVVGGHFDHLGRGEYGSLAGSKGRGVVHNGADDNASGTAAVLEVARFLAGRRESLRRDVVFVLFTGEELGLLGSKHYVGDPVVPLANTVTMVNLDMVGRLGTGALQVGGTGTSPIFPGLLDEKNRRLRLKTRYNPGGQAPSDNSPFYDAEIPVLFFFTGLHGDYHRPKDDWNRIDRRGFPKVVTYAAEVCHAIAIRAERPPFTKADGSGISAGPHLGLSVALQEGAVRVIYVEPDSPAAAARLEVGDVIEEFEGRPITTPSEFADAHSKTKPRQKITLTVRRGRRVLEVDVKLGRS